MKLRNKRTGKIVELEKIVFKNARTEDLLKWKTYEPNVNSLAELNEEWGDYQPTEPLIDDKEIRDIIRAWADVNDAGKLKYNYDENSLDDIYRNTITFNMGLGLKDGEEYTITELCGEEEDA